MNLQRLCLIFLCFFQFGCAAYRWGSNSRALPGNYKKIAIPIFKNSTQEPNIEVYFTNALMQEFLRSPVAEVTQEGNADILVNAVITDLTYKPLGEKTKDSGLVNLPIGSVLATNYAIYLTVNITLMSTRDGKVLWQQAFSNEKIYQAPQVTKPIINSVNPIYNLSARRQSIELLATTMMQEAFNRMTENF